MAHFPHLPNHLTALYMQGHLNIQEYAYLSRLVESDQRDLITEALIAADHAGETLVQACLVLKTKEQRSDEMIKVIISRVIDQIRERAGCELQGL